MKFGQFCPIAKSMEIVGEKWTLLIIRELLMGSTHFNELQNALGMISPALLSKRLQKLVDFELIVKKKIQGKKGFEYFPTESAKELLPILVSIGNWGMRWTRKYLTSDDFDASFLMTYLKRSIITENLPGKQTIIKFHFTDFDKQPHWWIVISGHEIDVCTIDPNQDVDVYFTSTVECLVNIWMGESTYKKETNEKRLILVGRKELTKDVAYWLNHSVFSNANN